VGSSAFINNAVFYICKLDKIKLHVKFLFSGSALQELSKDKPVMKNVESHTTTFIKTLVEVEKKLTGHINYLTQVSTGV
jgi:hypothetical protein